MIYSWQDIATVTYRSETMDGYEVIYPISSKRGELKTVDFETAINIKFEFRDSEGDLYIIKDIKGNEITCNSLFSINYNQGLMVNMDYKGQMDVSLRPKTINSQGWDRNSKTYFKSLLEKHPEWFVGENTDLIQLLSCLLSLLEILQRNMFIYNLNQVYQLKYYKCLGL